MRTLQMLLNTTCMCMTVPLSMLVRTVLKLHRTTKVSNSVAVASASSIFRIQRLIWIKKINRWHLLKLDLRYKEAIQSLDIVQLNKLVPQSNQSTTWLTDQQQSVTWTKHLFRTNTWSQEKSLASATELTMSLIRLNLRSSSTPIRCQVAIMASIKPLIASTPNSLTNLTNLKATKNINRCYMRTRIRFMIKLKPRMNYSRQK